jgi:CheY-like chemotaxis protein
MTTDAEHALPTRQGDRDDRLLVLVAEDDFQFARFLCEVLEQLGYRTQVASDGEAALDLFSSSVPDIVLTDLVMPAVDGVELIVSIRRRNSAIPIIAMSGGSLRFAESYLKVAQTLGAKAVLEKPFPIDTLRSALDSVRAEFLDATSVAAPGVTSQAS